MTRVFRYLSHKNAPGDLENVLLMICLVMGVVTKDSTHAVLDLPIPALQYILFCFASSIISGSNLYI